MRNCVRHICCVGIFESLQNDQDYVQVRRVYANPVTIRREDRSLIVTFTNIKCKLHELLIPLISKSSRTDVKNDD